jgi:Tol biopolymer transport system component
MKKRFIFFFSLTILVAGHCIPASAQGFGRNKPKYKKFDFEVYKTTHFDIYHYFKNKEVIENLAWQSELWHEYIQSLVRDTILFQNPLIFYAGHGDFQQTNTISSTVGVTTGGVTEAFKNRVTMPLTVSNQKTFQVLGHELVHAFQFDMIIRGDSTSLESLANLPLFMVEGMAEYMTRGRIDPYTSMWMRDIVLNDKIPTIKELFNPKYFPYRYGQAFWSIMTDRYGDEVMRELLRATAKYGLEVAAPALLEEDMDGLTEIWKNGLKNHYEPLMPNEKEDFIGRKLLDDKNAGRLNLSPAISPNGKYVIFLSEKGIFTTELFLADAGSGKIIRKIASTLKDNDFDNLDAFESAGTWSPDSKRYAFVGFSKGRNKIFAKTVDNARDDIELFVEGINEINSLSWSPNGKFMAFTGIKDGQIDLFMIDVKTEKITQLTDNIYAEIQPNWSTDGDRLVFSTDQVSMTSRPKAGPWYHNIAVLDVKKKSVAHLPIFNYADNLNPQFDENDDIWFLSDRDGFRNIYKFEVAQDSLFQQTEFMTGVSGISSFAPALSIARKRDKILFTHYFDGKYEIYGAKERAFLRKPVAKNDVDKKAGTLPGDMSKTDQVNTGLATIAARQVPNADGFEPDEYRAKLTLDALQGSAGAGVSTGLYGSQAGGIGGVQGIWSDVLGDHTVGVLASINGELEDAGIGAQYINKKGRVHWGFGLTHSPPQRAVLGDNRLTPTPDNPNVFTIDNRVIRIFSDQVSLLGIYPINTTLRLEGNLSTTFQYYSDKIYTTFVDNLIVDNQGRVFGYRVLGEERNKIKHNGEDFVVPVNINGQIFNYQFRYGLLHNAGVAIVGDNSYFGLTSPLAGYRFRLGVDQYTGLYDFTALNADFRKYFWLKPVSIGFRAFHYARYGKDQASFSPIFLPWQGLVRMGGRLSSQELFNDYGISIPHIQGSKILMGNAEVRLPFTGPKQISVITSNFLFTELAGFIDSGVAFDQYDDVEFSTKRDETAQLPLDKSVVIVTAGLSLRINLFGAIILEPYYAWPLRENSKANFGFNFLMPGW